MKPDRLAAIRFCFITALTLSQHLPRMLATMWAFLKSVLLGAIAGVVPVLVIFAMIWSPREYTGLFLQFEILFLVSSIGAVLGDSIVIGLPLTDILKFTGWESGVTYIAVAAIVGFFLPLTVYPLHIHGVVMAVCGAIGGAVTGRSWWVYGRRQYVED